MVFLDSSETVPQSDDGRRRIRTAETSEAGSEVRRSRARILSREDPLARGRSVFAFAVIASIVRCSVSRAVIVSAHGEEN